nr:peptide chain release factor N(5)-glutamine methyltransferase [Limisphaera ngatamarikiensis]
MDRCRSIWHAPSVVTVLEAIQRSAEFLGRKGVDAPRLQAELLLAHVLRLPRLKLYLQFDRALTPAETDQLRELVRRRGQREPLQYILGRAAFCGRDLLVNPHVLIPRPETEQLAELGWTRLAACPGPRLALDVGTGSGCIAIALVEHCPDTRCVAVDVSPEALNVARENVAAAGLTDRIELLPSRELEAVPAQPRFDLIISNPPYIPSGDIASLQPEVRDHEPRTALDGGPDGLDAFRWLAPQARARIRPSGLLLLECGDGQPDAVVSILREHNWVVTAVHPDYTGRPRFVEARPG